MCFPVISGIVIPLFPRVIINFQFFLSNDRWPCSKTEKNVKAYLFIHLTMFLTFNHNSQIFK